MSYHTATFQLLGFESQDSGAAEAAVQEVETRLAIPFPRSVRDWYVREDAVKILADHSNADPPIPM
jgi:cell wall assembly regulator SMI1